jgi:predicted anti-sigma-YlaC factor YlaD
MDGGGIKKAVELLMRPWVATCAETRERLSAHLEGELRGRESKRVLRHLARCERCREVLRSLARAVDALRSLGQADVAPPAPSAAESIADRLRPDTS